MKLIVTSKIPRTLSIGDGPAVKVHDYFALASQYGFIRAISVYVGTRVSDLIANKIRPAMQYLWWASSAPAPNWLRELRERRCDECPRMVRVFHPMQGAERRYCGSCPCGHTARADLKLKNARLGQNCPEGFQPWSVRTLPVVEPATPSAATKKCSGGCKAKHLPVVPEMAGEGI